MSSIPTVSVGLVSGCVFPSGTQVSPGFGCSGYRHANHHTRPSAGLWSMCTCLCSPTVKLALGGGWGSVHAHWGGLRSKREQEGMGWVKQRGWDKPLCCLALHSCWLQFLRATPRPLLANLPMWLNATCHSLPVLALDDSHHTVPNCCSKLPPASRYHIVPPVCS